MVVLKVIFILQVLLNSVSLITQTGNCSNYQKWARNGGKLSSICDALRDLVAFVQFKKREKHWLKPATLLKLTLLHGCFSRFLNCTNATKSRYVKPKLTYNVIA